MDRVEHVLGLLVSPGKPCKLASGQLEHRLEARTERPVPDSTYPGIILLTILIVSCSLFTDMSFSVVVPQEHLARS